MARTLYFDSTVTNANITIDIYLHAPVTCVFGMEEGYSVLIEDDKDKDQVVSWAFDAIENKKLLPLKGIIK